MRITYIESVIAMPLDNEHFYKSFYQTLERSIAALPQTEREALYRPCAVACVQSYVLKEQQRQFAECGGNLDLQYERYGSSPYFFAQIIERGHCYELGYPGGACLCPMVQSGMANTAVHCECSRQSMLYVLQTLLPHKKIKVELLHSVLSGAQECRFRATVD